MAQPTIDRTDISLEAFETLEGLAKFARNSAMLLGYCLIIIRNSSIGTEKRGMILHFDSDGSTQE